MDNYESIAPVYSCLWNLSSFIRKRNAFSLLLILLLFLRANASPGGTIYFVSPEGKDANEGTSLRAPLQTIQRAASLCSPGDSCLIRGGVYRESVKLTRSGLKDNPIIFCSYNGERVIIDGSDLVAGPWSKSAGGVWSSKVPVQKSVESVFYDGVMMTEARWPACAWEENWNSEKKWALSEKGSKLGQICSDTLASSRLDLSGGTLYLKLSKGNSCYTRPVTGHRAGNNTLIYDKSGIEGRAWQEDSTSQRIEKYGFAGNRFFVVAHGALKLPRQWWHDTVAGQLLFIPPTGDEPAQHQLSYKARVTGFEGDSVSDVVLEGLEFRACNIRFQKASRITLHDCRFIYPATPKLFTDADSDRKLAQNLRIEGEDNVVDHCLVQWAIDTAVEVEGGGNRVENCLIHDCNLHGRHAGPGISMRGAGGTNLVRHNTVYNCGGVGIYTQGQGSVTIEYNHVFNCGLYCVDVSSFYVPIGAKMQGTMVHHNWFHDIHGLGFRVDTQGCGITFDHNLVWNVLAGCKLQGFALIAYNNTLLATDPRNAFTAVFEPEATPEERAAWRIQNNVAYGFNDRLSLRSDHKHAGRPFLLPLKSVPQAIDHNVKVNAGEESHIFVDFAHQDFRPRTGGPLDSTGTPLSNMAGNQNDRPPSIGALETDIAPWLAGAEWMVDQLPIPSSPYAATELAHRLLPTSCPLIQRDSQYENQ